MYIDQSASWSFLRERATQVLPSAGKWALEIIVDGHWQPFGRGCSPEHAAKLAEKYEHADMEILPRVCSDWGHAVSRVEATRQSHSMTTINHAFSGGAYEHSGKEKWQEFWRTFVGPDLELTRIAGHSLMG